MFIFKKWAQRHAVIVQHNETIPKAMTRLLCRKWKWHNSESTYLRVRAILGMNETSTLGKRFKSTIRILSQDLEAQDGGPHSDAYSVKSCHE
jgi:hypothetical protein